MRTESHKAKNNNSSIDLGHNQSRRSFAKAGIVAPVILSLANRPAWGANVRCTPSGFGSLVEIGSGIDIADITCEYSGSTIINKTNLIKAAQNKKLMDLFGCDGPHKDITVKEALDGSDYLKNIVIAFYNAYPETTTTFINKGVEKTIRDLKSTVTIEANNPFGAGCPVERVYCHFEANDDDKPFRLGTHTEMTKLEITYFLSIILNQ